jgi:putative hydrolase of the HAD superfamily
MGDGDMKIRAVIFDVYGTLMQVGPPPGNADELWQKLFQEFFQKPPPLGRLEFSVACNRAIALRHNAAHARGIAKPEILWPAIVAEILPGTARLDAASQAEFIYRQIQIGRSISLMPGVGPILRWLADKRLLLGIASNAQAYTLRELDTMLKTGGISFSVFDPELAYWSYQNGFSKPDPHGYQIIRTRLEARGISPIETLMIGDRLDNDVAPARLQGFQTWHLNATSPEKQSGPWEKLREFLVRSV